MRFDPAPPAQEMETQSEGNSSRRSGRLFTWFALLAVVLVTLSILILNGSYLTRPKFLQRFKYESRGWSRFDQKTTAGDTEIFWLDVPPSEVAKAMDSQLKGRSHWVSLGFLPGYGLAYPGQSLTDVTMGVLVVPGHVKRLEDVEPSIGKPPVKRGSTVIAVYSNRSTTWDRLKIWLLEGW